MASHQCYPNTHNLVNLTETNFIVTFELQYAFINPRMPWMKSPFYDYIPLTHWRPYCSTMNIKIWFNLSLISILKGIILSSFYVKYFLFCYILLLTKDLIISVHNCSKIEQRLQKLQKVISTSSNPYVRRPTSQIQLVKMSGWQFRSLRKCSLYLKTWRL